MALPLTAEHLGHLDRLLEVALALDPSKRSAWLDTLAGEDAQLRPLVADLLSRAESLQANDFLGTLPKLTASTLLSNDSDRSTHTPGEVVGPYRLERELGRGGMGTVWLAERIGSHSPAHARQPAPPGAGRAARRPRGGDDRARGLASGAR